MNKQKIKRMYDAICYYETLGYTNISAPYIVDENFIDITIPSSKSKFKVVDKFLVASAEQSFLNLHEKLDFNTYYCAYTPCFRDEKEDETHLLFFDKLELFKISEYFNEKMVKDAFEYFLMMGVKAEIQETKIGYDIIDSKTGIELGSYGFRRSEELNIGWNYGTGLAEPRLSIVLEKSK